MSIHSNTAVLFRLCCESLCKLSNVQEESRTYEIEKWEPKVFFYTCDYGHLKCMLSMLRYSKELLYRVDRTWNDYTALHTAALKGHSEICKVDPNLVLHCTPTFCLSGQPENM